MRSHGEKVWLRAGAGFCGESNRLQVEIPQDSERDPFCIICDGDECAEWSTVWTLPDPDNNGERYTLCHVSECEMFDEPQP